MNIHKNSHVGWMGAVGFLSSCLSIYSASNEALSAADDGQFLVFFSRSFLRERKWVVIPLWEGDLRLLKLEGGEEVSVTGILRDHCLGTENKYLNVASIESAQWPYLKDAMAATISHKEINLVETDPAILFETSSENMPYWGHNFLWPDDQRFVVYTNGDNAAFIAGDRTELEAMLGFKYSYGLERLVAQNASHPGWQHLVGPYTAFCAEFA